MIQSPIASYPRQSRVRRLDRDPANILIQSHPYHAIRVNSDCRHSSAYLMLNREVKLVFCALCYLREGWLGELPKQIHVSRELAENGNPQTSPKFINHLFVAVGLVPPSETEDLKMFREKRKPSRARGQYTMPAQSEPYWSLFPVGSALWKLMGFQPPLARVLTRAVVRGQTELDISTDMKLSVFDVSIRMIKGIRTAMGFLPYASTRDHNPTRDDDGQDRSSSRSSEQESQIA